MLSFLLTSPAPAEPDVDEELVLDEPIVEQPLGGLQLEQEEALFIEDRVGKKKKRKKNKTAE